MSFWKWSRTASSNSTADGSINWAEGQAPSTVNDSARAMMAAASKWRDDISGGTASAGTSTAYTLTSYQTFDTLAHMDGALLCVKIHTDCGASPTLAVDGLTAKAINITNGVAVPTGGLKATTRYLLSYDNSNNQFLIVNPFVAAMFGAGGVSTSLIADAAVTYAKIQNVSAGKLLGGSLAPGGAAAAMAEQIIPFGQCQLTKSGSNLLLSVYRGNLILINSKVYAIPDSGPTLSTGGLSASTLYYIYVYDNSGTLTLEASATAYATQAGTGIKIKNGDATRTLVGLAYTTSGTAWADSTAQRFVRSWFNDPGSPLAGLFSTTRATSSGSATEINTEARVEFLAWSGEAALLDLSGTVQGSTTPMNVSSGIGIDSGGTMQTPSNTSIYVAAAGGNVPISVQLAKSGLAEGYHYATVLGSVSTGTGTWQTGTGIQGYLRNYS